MKQSGIWSKDWIRSLELSEEEDSKKLKLYPLQFANCDRLESNNCVFIFDEVGTGKTISSGLMTMHYLYNNPEKRALVITTHSVKEQFKRDWYSKMPFEKMGYDYRIDFIGNHYVNLTNVNKIKYGLIIVDEAQLFLNEGTKKQDALRALKSDKVVFLTATPVKEGKDDLAEFVELAEGIVGAESVTKVRNLLCGNEPWNADRVKKVYKVNSFDEKHPITRYFKDTIKNLEHEYFIKQDAVRQEILLWKYNNKDECYPALYDKIEEKLKEKPDSRFIVFTRTKSENIEGSAGELGTFFREKGYQDFDHFSAAERTYKILDGDVFQDKDAFDRFQKKPERPTVLFLTYQVGEQGLNLAGFDYVINLHISRYPANLEQRYGRIDRLNSGGHKVFKEIYMVFLLEKFGSSTNRHNYYEALSTYINSLLPFFPSRNVLLDKENLAELRSWLNEKKINTGKGQQRRLDELAEQQGYYGEEIKCFDDLPQEEQAELRRMLEKEESEKSDKKEELLKKIDVMERDLPDSVFFADTTDEWKVRLLGRPVDFGDEIRESDSYKQYCDKFNEEVKFRNLEHKYRDKISHFFFERFFANDFDSLFPFAGYRKIFERILAGDEFRELREDNTAYNYFLGHCDSIVKRLPFFLLCEKYGYLIWNYSLKNSQQPKNGYSVVPFVLAAAVLLNKEERDCIEYFQLAFNKETKQIEASNWYKLAYHYTRKEHWLLRSLKKYKDDWSFCRREYEEDRVKKTENFFYRREWRLKQINSMTEQELEELREKLKAKGETLKDYGQKVSLREEYKYRTLFAHFFFTNRGKFRSVFDSEQGYEKLLEIKTEQGFCSLGKLLDVEKKAEMTDYWTRGIMYSLFGWEWDEKNPALTWAALLPDLPEELKNERIY